MLGHGIVELTQSIFLSICLVIISYRWMALAIYLGTYLSHNRKGLLKGEYASGINFW